MISDKAKTFKSALGIIPNVLDKPEVKAHFSKLQVKWKFNLEKASWWGGIFELMVRSTKCCLKKAVGRARLIYDELRPLSLRLRLC